MVAPTSLAAPEKASLDEPRVISQKPSQVSLASATIIASNEKLSSSSDVSCPPSAMSHGNPFETDIEAMITHTNSGGAETINAINTKSSAKSGRKGPLCGEAQVWPGQRHWKQKAKEQKIQRSRTCLSRLGKRQRLIAKILLGLFVLSIAVGVGLGISKPLGASIWGQKN